MSKKQFPKVLLLGHSFNDFTGMGITLTNLFHDWPTEQIGIMSDNLDINLVESIRPCSIYIGETKNINSSSQIDSNGVVGASSSFRSRIRKIYYDFGLNEIFGKTKILPINSEQAKSFSPDIVLCALGTLNRMLICEDLMSKLTDAHLVIYIVDDWINSRVVEKKPVFLWKRLFFRLFNRILKLSSGNLSICEAMSQSYLKQFGVQFIPFHNPVDVSYWSNLKCKKKYPENVVSLLYVGKINVDTEECLIDCAKSVESLNHSGMSICFDVYSPDSLSKESIFNDYPNCHLFQSVSHDEIPTITKSYDALFLTLGFSETTIKYVKLSMPTKLSEYLASGLPIVLYSPKGVALTDYVVSRNCAFVCSVKDADKLQDTMQQLFDKEKVNYIVQRSLEVAKEHDISKVREMFRITMNIFISK